MPELGEQIEEKEIPPSDKGIGKVARRVSDLTGRITGALLWVAAAALLFMMGVTVVNVFGRALFNSPVLGALELVSLSGVLLISFVIGYTMYTNRNVVTSIVVDKLPGRVRAIFDSVTLFMTLFLVLVMTWATAEFGWQEVTAYHKTTLILGLSIGPFKAVWVIGCLILSLAAFGNLLKALSRGKKQ